MGILLTLKYVTIKRRNPMKLNIVYFIVLLFMTFTFAFSCGDDGSPDDQNNTARPTITLLTNDTTQGNPLLNLSKAVLVEIDPATEQNKPSVCKVIRDNGTIHFYGTEPLTNTCVGQYTDANVSVSGTNIEVKITTLNSTDSCSSTGYFDFDGYVNNISTNTTYTVKIIMDNATLYTKTIDTGPSLEITEAALIKSTETKQSFSRVIKENGALHFWGTEPLVNTCEGEYTSAEIITKGNDIEIRITTLNSTDSCSYTGYFEFDGYLRNIKANTTYAVSIIMDGISLYYNDEIFS